MHDRVIAAITHANLSVLEKALSGFRAPSTQALGDQALEREKPVLDFTLEGVATSVAGLRDSTRHALDDLASKIHGLKVERIKIDGYDPVLSVIGGERADAVMGYLSARGVDKNLMWTEGHWRKPWDRDFKLADKHCVVIKVYAQLRDRRGNDVRLRAGPATWTGGDVPPPARCGTGPAWMAR